MHHLTRVALSVAILSALSFSRWASARESTFELERGTRVLPPIRFKHLSLFPVVTDGGDSTRYLSLAEGLKQKKVRVTEVKQGAQVNRVLVENDSDLPLLILGGELILGGQQDRVISKDTLMAPRQQASLEVYCVEHGRWQGTRDFGIAGALVQNEIRLQAKHRPDQNKVWQAVADRNVAFGAAPPTGTYRNVATGPEGAKAIEPYRTAIGAGLAALPQAKQMTGIIAAINGRVVSLDVFSTPALFAAHRDRLLDSIFLSAAGKPATSAAEKTPSESDIKSFVIKADSAPAEVIIDDAKSRTIQRHAKEVVNSTVEAKSGGKLGTVYKSYQAAE